MDRKLWALVYSLVMRIDHPHSSKTWISYSDRIIVLVEMWAHAHDQSILWATSAEHWRWPELMPAAVPHQTTMSRRLRTASVAALRDAIYAELRGICPDERGWLCEIDGRPLTVSGFSKDPDARWGYATKSHAKGFKFHSIWDAGLVPAAWEVRSMNVAEPVVAVGLVQSLPEGMTGYLLGDASYDSNPLHSVTSSRNLQLVAPPKKKHRGLGHQRHEPSRLRSLHLVNTPFGKALYAQRTKVERNLGHLVTNPVGLDRLPWHVRRQKRVHRFVHSKLILEGCYRWLQLSNHSGVPTKWTHPNQALPSLA